MTCLCMLILDACLLSFERVLRVQAAVSPKQSTTAAASTLDHGVDSRHHHKQLDEIQSRSTSTQAWHRCSSHLATPHANAHARTHEQSRPNETENNRQLNQTPGIALASAAADKTTPPHPPHCTLRLHSCSDSRGPPRQHGDRRVASCTAAPTSPGGP